MGPGDSHTQHVTSSARRIAWRITGIYTAVGALWILFSDRVLALLIDNPDTMLRLQTYKGWAYVACTGLLLLWLLLRHLRQLERERAKVSRLNRTYQFLSGINNAIVRVRAREELLQTACNLAVTKGQFLGARILLREVSGTGLHVEAQAGVGSLLPAWVATLPEPEPTGPLWINRLTGPALPDAFRKPASRQGVHAVAALPIPHWSNLQPARGWLELYSGNEQAFDALETVLLQEIAADIGLGLETIDKSANLQTLAYYDALTGLPNAALLADHLEQTLSRAQHDRRAVAVIVLDCPELTRVADVRGRHVGDQLRKALAEYLAATVRDGDTVARTGQDEFTVVLADMAHSEDVVALSERLLRGPTVRVDDDPLPMPLPMRGGAALFPVDADNAETLLQHAALALHTTSVAPGTCEFYSPSLNAAAHAQLQLEHELQHAIERQELSVVYQLTVDAQTQRPTGAEALLRWHNHTLGEVGPAQFIPVAETCGLIHGLGHWVLEHVCRQIATWRAAGLDDLVVSVNVAAPQLLRADFLSELREILVATGCRDDSYALAIEVTETAVIRDLERAAAVLREIRDLGVRVYLDDFGTGYSSLSYLSQLPIDVLKIDYSFVSRLPHEQRAVSLVKAVIALAHSLGLDVVAEGVESDEQLQLLRQLGCNLIQGFLFSRPASPQSIPGLVAQLRAH